jgi:nucleotide-binding universal stress UspA family protein
MPALAEARGLDFPDFVRILCAIDVDQPTPAALGLAGFFAARFGAALEALYVGTVSNGAEPELEMRLNRIVERVSAPRSTVKLATGVPARAIVERASERRCDLIVLGARQRSDLGWQFRDDVVRDVTTAAPCATLTVHERDTPEAIDRVLVPVDLGPSTPRVVDWACAIALAFGAELQLLHVVSRERCSPSGRDRAELSALTRRVALRGVKASADVIVAGGAANGIESYNDRGEFDLVVMGLGGGPQRSPRLARGVVATLRNRLSIPLLAVPSPSFDGTKLRANEPRVCARARDGASLSA